MRETFRLSDAPQFYPILVNFALRLDKNLNDENVVLSQVRTLLKYHNGEEFFYTLDPANFRVEQYEDVEREFSPINGLYRWRKVVYSIRDVDGNWHRPIGTTSILTHILGLDPKGNRELEKALLDAAHQKKQQELLARNGEDMRGYGRDNQLKESLLTQAYLDSLRDTDPLYQHLQQLLHSHIPLNREGLRLLRAESKRLTPAQIRKIQATPILSRQSPVENQQSVPSMTEPSVLRSDTGQRILPRAIVDDLRPHVLLLQDALPEHLQADLKELFESQEGEEVICTKEMLVALRQVTDEELTIHELEERKAHKKIDIEVSSAQMLACWTEVVANLEEPLTPLRAARLKHHLERSKLKVCEISSLRTAWRELRIRGALSDEALADEALLGGNDQRRWYGRRDFLRLHMEAEQAPLLERIKRSMIRSSDLPALKRLWQAVEDAHLSESQITMLQKRPQLVQAIPMHLQEDFKLAIQHNNFPPYLRTALTEMAQQLELDVETLAPPNLPDNVRKTLLKGWHHVIPYLDDKAPQLYAALKTRRYTVAQAKQLEQLLTMSLPKAPISEDDRKYLLQRQSWKGMYSRVDYSFLLTSLEKQNYTIHSIILLAGLVQRVKKHERREEEKAQDRERRKAEEAAKQSELLAQELYQRLSARWKSLKPKYEQLLQSISAADLLRDLPIVCQEFQENASNITLDLENTICKYLDNLKITLISVK